MFNAPCKTTTHVCYEAILSNGPNYDLNKSPIHREFNSAWAPHVGKQKGAQAGEGCELTLDTATPLNPLRVTSGQKPAYICMEAQVRGGPT